MISRKTMANQSAAYPDLLSSRLRWYSVSRHLVATEDGLDLMKWKVLYPAASTLEVDEIFCTHLMEWMESTRKLEKFRSLKDSPGMASFQSRSTLLQQVACTTQVAQDCTDAFAAPAGRCPCLPQRWRG